MDVSGFTHANNGEVFAALREAVARAPRGQWIYAMGIDPILVPDLELPTRASLDAIAPDQPLVVVSQTMHSFWANSRAFAAAGIDRGTPDPGRGSFCERDVSGELTASSRRTPGSGAGPMVRSQRSSRRAAATDPSQGIPPSVDTEGGEGATVPARVVSTGSDHGARLLRVVRR